MIIKVSQVETEVGIKLVKVGIKVGVKIDIRTEDVQAKRLVWILKVCGGIVIMEPT